MIVLKALPGKHYLAEIDINILVIQHYATSFESNQNLLLFNFSDVKQTVISPTPYMIIAHCAKALSTVHALFRDFDINVDTKISKVSYHFVFSIVSHIYLTLKSFNYFLCFSYRLSSISEFKD